jgi:hypothetical protein
VSVLTHHPEYYNRWWVESGRAVPMDVSRESSVLEAAEAATAGVGLGVTPAVAGLFEIIS